MPAILPTISPDADTKLGKHFLPYQINWILAEDALHAQSKQAFALAEKSIRIGWTYADAFKNVRKRLRHKMRDYLFATKDYASALEYIRQCYRFAEIFNFTRAIASYGEEYLKVPRLDQDGHPTGFTDEIKVGYVKFTNGSRIIAFSANPQAMAVYGGDVGLDEFAKHPNAQLLWETAQGRVTWGYDLAVWSAHDGEDTLFYQFAQEARAKCGAGVSPAGSAGVPPAVENQKPKATNPSINSQPSAINCPWNLYYHVTMPDAVELGLLQLINKARKTNFTPAQFLADCRARARLEEIFQQAYMCNPVPGGAQIVGWSAIDRCRADYQIERLHLESDQILTRFGEFNPATQREREAQIVALIRAAFPTLLTTRGKYRLGFDVAASGQGDLAAIYIDEAKGNELWLRALFTCRTEDWHFLKTVLFHFLRNLSLLQAAGDETGLGRQICWEAAKLFPSRFSPVNFSTLKHDIGFALMNQLATGEKRFPKAEQDIASDYFALRKAYRGTKWVFTEGPNGLNPTSHCDIAWAGGLATHANTHRRPTAGGLVG